MDCTQARPSLLARNRGELEPNLEAELDAHLQTCSACRRYDQLESVLSEALARLPRRTAPATLKRTLEARYLPKHRLYLRAAAIALAATFGAGLLAIAVVPQTNSPKPMLTEAVNDHLRILYAERRVEVESGGIHQVKPWFEGRLDFAPLMPFAGDDDFPLQGGSVAWLLDRKAAAFVFRRRLHLVTVFVFRADGLSWPATNTSVGRLRGTEFTARGFHALFFRSSEQGYAIVSDVDPRELQALGTRLVQSLP